jgi:galactonate dehydratase
MVDRMPAKTRISEATVHLVDHYAFVRIRTEDGAEGIGQSGYFGFPQVTGAILEPLRSVLLGQDPDEIGRLNLELFRAVSVRGGALTSTIGAVDLALWDLKGRRFEVPAYDLVGGRHRHKVRLHLLMGQKSWPRASTPEDLLEDARLGVAEGFTAVKIDPFVEGEDGFHVQTSARRINKAIEIVEELRSIVGKDVDLGVECHRKLTTGEAIQFAQRLERLNIHYLEDPLPPDSISEYARLAQAIRVPLAVGERHDTFYEFEDLLDAGIGDFLRPDIGNVGGLSASIKIAALAEARHRRMIAHNFLSPYLTAAALQLYAAIPNTGTFEWTPLDEEPHRAAMLTAPLPRNGGWLDVPEAPGLGVDIAPGYLEAGPEFAAPPAPGSLRTQDGSIHAI